jgi:opacity protein-like surface antigen
VSPELLIAAVLTATHAQAAALPMPLSLNPGDRIVITNEKESIRGRIAEITGDTLILDGGTAPVRVPLTAVQKIDRVGDSLFNGSAIGAAIGGGSTLALLAKICSNSGCADTSENLDPRLTLLGTLIGAGVGAIVDAAIDGRKTIYTTGAPKPVLTPEQTQAQAARAAPARFSPTVFGRFGWARLTDDEGWLGDGATVGVGVIVHLTERIGLQVAYDRHDHRRDFESAGPPGTPTSGGFTGTEQLVAAKALFFFRPGQIVNPYAGIGVGFIDSKRVSEFPTFELPPGSFFPVPGPPEVFRYHSRGAGLGFAAGVDVHVTSRLSVLGDLTLDLNNPEALGSTRLTVGAGWRF